MTVSPLRLLDLDEKDLLRIRDLHLITQKPVMYVVNVDEGGFENNAHLDAVVGLAKQEGAEVVVICAAIEAEIALLDDEDKLEFLSDLGLEEPGLDRVIRCGYTLLGLQTYFTAGEKEVRAWTTKVGATAPRAAAEIHTDFEKGFIRAESHRVMTTMSVETANKVPKRLVGYASKARSTSFRKAT